MKIYVNKNDDTITISVTGRLDAGNYSELQDTVDGLDFASAKVVFDFGGLEYISSSGLRVLLAARKKAGEGGMKIVNAGDEVLDIFTMTGFDAIIDIEKAEIPLKKDDFLKLSFRELLEKMTEAWPDRVFLRHQGKAYTWREIDQCSQIIAADLAKQGVRRGTHVGLCSANSVNWALTFFAIQKLGAVACLINFNYTAEEMKLISTVGDITHLCYGEMRQMKDNKDYLTSIVDQPGSMIAHVYDIRSELDFRDRLAEYDSVAEEAWPKVYADDVSVMIYTSGSTGRPKGVLLTAYNLLNASAIRAGITRVGPDDKACLILPLFHTFGLTAGFFCNALCGASVVIPNEINTRTILDTIETEKCTLFHSVPTMIIALMGNKDFSSKRVASLRCINFGGAPVSRTQILKMKEAFPNAHFLVNYGLSEASPTTITDYDDTDEHLCDTVGKPISEVELRIIDRNTKEDCPVGTAGEILIRGFNLMCSYYKLPLEQQAIDEKGWIHSGDMGWLDKDGYLHFAGRYKELIIRGGENIMPNEIAAVISQHSDVQDVKVVGVPDEFYGETVCACVVMKEGIPFDEERIRTFLSTRLTKQKIPTYFMVLDTIPKLANGKPDLVNIRKAAEEKFAKNF